MEQQSVPGLEVDCRATNHQLLIFVVSPKHIGNYRKHTVEILKNIVFLHLETDFHSWPNGVIWYQTSSLRFNNQNTGQNIWNNYLRYQTTGSGLWIPVRETSGAFNRPGCPPGGIYATLVQQPEESTGAVVT